MKWFVFVLYFSINGETSVELKNISELFDEYPFETEEECRNSELFQFHELYPPGGYYSFVDCVQPPH